METTNPRSDAQGSRTNRFRGAYGLFLEGELFSDPIYDTLLVEAEDHWPPWEIQWKQLTADASNDAPVETTWSHEFAQLATQPSGTVTIDRASACTTLVLANPPSPAALAHPYIGSTGMVVSRWLGRIPFHAGAFIVDGRAWGVLGGREMGKSSLLMGVREMGIPILTDDLLVVSGATALAGPRCLDLRKSAAEHFASGRYLGVVGTRERWRVGLDAVPSETPFAGWVLLDWAPTTGFRTPPPAERLSALAVNRGVLVPEAIGDGLMDPLGFPMVSFSRPFDWSQMESALSALLDVLAST